MPRTDGFDWELIKQAYRTGRFSLLQLQERYGPNKATISRRAAKEGWEKDLTQKVRQRTREKVTRATLPEEAKPHYDKRDTDSDEVIVEQAADENMAVVKAHRSSLLMWRNVNQRYIELLTAQMVDNKVTVLDRHGYVKEIDQPLEYFGKCMSYGAQAMDRIIKLERQSYGMDEDSGDDGLQTFEELMAEVAPSDFKE